MNPEISKNKFDKFVNRESVQETMDLLISVLSAMYESDQ
jgi:predicted secreted protein